jgi:hypothetical protein
MSDKPPPIRPAATAAGQLPPAGEATHSFPRKGEGGAKRRMGGRPPEHPLGRRVRLRPLHDFVEEGGRFFWA